MSCNVFDIVHEYVRGMIPVDGSMKVLLLDAATLKIISVAFSQRELLQHGVFLVDDITNADRRQRMPTMRCVCFVRPSSLDALCAEVRSNKYQSYSIVFSNAVTAEALDQLARADVGDAVSHVEEYFADFEAVNRDSFVVPLPNNAISGLYIDNPAYRRAAEGLAAMFVALRRKPHVRFHGQSFLCKRIAAELGSVLKSDLELYDYRPKDTLLLILDRNEDPVTPLLTPWTYQAMLHELVGLDQNKLTISDAAAVAKDDAGGYVFSQADDEFFAKNMYLNWGDLCGNVKAYVDACKKELNIDRTTATIEEVKQFMQKLPQTKHLTTAVTKHATVVSHLATIIRDRALLDLSELEQDMVVNVDQSGHFTRLQELAKSGKAAGNDLIRLCMLFNLRYEKGLSPSRTDPLLAAVTRRSLVRKVREYFGAQRSTDNLFTHAGVMGSLSSMVKGFTDVKNLYTQHEPVLKKTLLAAAQGKLEGEAFPYLSTPPPQGPAYRPKEIIVYMVGGFTFEEAAVVSMVNAGWQDAANKTGPAQGASAIISGIPDVKVLLGGSGIHNTRSFLESLDQNP